MDGIKRLLCAMLALAEGLTRRMILPTALSADVMRDRRTGMYYLGWQLFLASQCNDLFRFLDELDKIGSVNDVLDMIFYRIDGGTVNALPADGLSDMRPATDDTFFAEEEEEEAPEPRLSRPKLEEEVQAA